MSDLRVPIERGVPMPEHPRTRAWPFATMEIGDSFVVPDRWKNSVLSSVSGYWNKRGKKFVTRKVDGVLRCWRVE